MIFKTSDYDASIKRAQVIAKVMLNNEVIDRDTYNKLFVNKVEIYGKRNDNEIKHNSNSGLVDFNIVQGPRTYNYFKLHSGVCLFVHGSAM